MSTAQPTSTDSSVNMGTIVRFHARISAAAPKTRTAMVQSRADDGSGGRRSILDGTALESGLLVISADVGGIPFGLPTSSLVSQVERRGDRLHGPKCQAIWHTGLSRFFAEAPTTGIAEESREEKSVRDDPLACG